MIQASVMEQDELIYFGVIVLNWNGGAMTYECLRSISAASVPACWRISVFLVDNGSTDGSVERCEQEIWPFELAIVRNGANLGFAGGNNRGIAAALHDGAKFVLILNNDTILSQSFFVNVSKAFDQAGSEVVLGGVLCSLKDGVSVDFCGAKWDRRAGRFAFPGEGEPFVETARSLKETDFVCGGALVAPSGAFEQIGGFDERFFLTWEDADWCYRARALGYTCFVVEDAVAFHHVSASFGGEGSSLRVYYSARNRLLWSDMHLGFAERSWIKWLTIKALLSMPTFRKPDRGLRGVFWAIRAWVRQWTNDRVRSARLRGTLDYVKGRFGKCLVAL